MTYKENSNTNFDPRVMSGGFKEYANLTLENSGTSCPSTGGNTGPYILRNCGSKQEAVSFQQGLYENDEFYARSASAITGIVTLINTNYGGGDTTEPAFVLRADDYIYTHYRTEDAGTYSLYVQEYKISTGDKQTILVTQADQSLIGAGMVHGAYIENRKIFVHDQGDYLNTTNNFYIVDFSSLTKTTELAVNWSTEIYAENLCVIKDNSGNIHLLAIGEYMIGAGPDVGIRIWHKNYTLSSAWSTYDCALSGFNYFEWRYWRHQIVDNHYLIGGGNAVTFGVNIYYTICWRFDVNTLSFSYSTIANPSTYESNGYVAGIDNTNKKLYYCDDNWVGDGTSLEIEYNPGSGISTTGTDPIGTLFETITSNKHAYYIQQNSGTHLASTGALVNNYNFGDLQFSQSAVCHIVDDGGGYGEIIWFFDASDGYLKAIGLNDGTIKKSIHLLYGGNPISLRAYQWLIHLGDCLMLIPDDNISQEFYLIQ